MLNIFKATTKFRAKNFRNRSITHTNVTRFVKSVSFTCDAILVSVFTALRCYAFTTSFCHCCCQNKTTTCQEKKEYAAEYHHTTHRRRSSSSDHIEAQQQRHHHIVVVTTEEHRDKYDGRRHTLPCAIVFFLAKKFLVILIYNFISIVCACVCVSLTLDILLWLDYVRRRRYIKVGPPPSSLAIFFSIVCVCVK